MTPASISLLLRKLAEQRANLTPKQRRKLIQHRFRAVLCARLFGKQSWQDHPMKIQVHVLRHLMTMGIPRNMIVIPLSILQKPGAMQSWLIKPGSGFFYPSGFEYKSEEWISSCFTQITQITTHPRKPFIAITGSDGRVWIGKIGDPKHLFRLIHNHHSKENERATTCAFHPLGDHIAVGVTGYVFIYKISSPSLDSELLKKVRFHEDPGYFCTLPPQFSPCEIQWHPSGTSFTAISHRNQGLSRAFVFKPETFDVTGETTHAYLFSILKSHTSPLCSCFSADGKFVATGYSDGNIMHRKVDHKEGRITSVLPDGNSIEKIEFNPHDPSILAIQTRSRGQNEVHLLKTSPDGSITILQTFENARYFRFDYNMFLLQNGNTITFYLMNSDNLPVKMTEFESQNGPIGSFSLTTLNGEVTLWYSHMCQSKLHMAELKVQ
jgi:WD40 repeat protein